MWLPGTVCNRWRRISTPEDADRYVVVWLYQHIKDADADEPPR